jgi:transcriptional regulator with XRE-family HTH domain
MTSVATAWIAEPDAAQTKPWGAVAPAVPFVPAPSRAGANESTVSNLVGRNLRRLRRQHRISLEELARRSGVSRAMLGQIEQAKSVPSIRTLWQVAQALDVSVSWFLESDHEPQVLLIPAPAESPHVLPSGEAELRTLQQSGETAREGFFEIRLAPGAALTLPPSTFTRRINVGVALGVLQVAVEDVWHVVRPREALQYETAQPLGWRNAGPTQVLAFVVIRAHGRAD